MWLAWERPLGRRGTWWSFIDIMEWCAQEGHAWGHRNESFLPGRYSLALLSVPDHASPHPACTRPSTPTTQRAWHMYSVPARRAHHMLQQAPAHLQHSMRIHSSTSLVLLAKRPIAAPGAAFCGRYFQPRLISQAPAIDASLQLRISPAGEKTRRTYLSRSGTMTEERSGERGSEV